MARKTRKPSGPRSSETELVRSKPTETGKHSRFDISSKFERKWFEYDRKAVLHQIAVVQRAIDQNSRELGMVATEGVFEQPLSDGLLRSSRALRAIAQELKTLSGLVARTSGYPKIGKKASR
jgi:hypothetical protein